MPLDQDRQTDLLSSASAPAPSDPFADALVEIASYDDLDVDDDAAVAAFMIVAGPRALSHYSRSKRHAYLWIGERLAFGVWLERIFEVLHPLERYDQWHERHASRHFSDQTGRNWRRLSRYVQRGFITPKTILGEKVVGALQRGAAAEARAEQATSSAAADDSTAASAAADDSSAASPSTTTRPERTPEDQSADDRNAARTIEIARHIKDNLSDEAHLRHIQMLNRLEPAAQRRHKKTSTSIQTAMHKFRPHLRPAEERGKPITLLADSGAYSAFNSGRRIDLVAYCDWLEANRDILKLCVTLDIIGGDPEDAAQQGWDNFLYMRARGLSPIPVYHFGESARWLLKYIERADVSYIGLSRTSHLGAGHQFYEPVVAIIRRERADLKIHAFGEFRPWILTNYAFTSADSTRLHESHRHGRIEAYADALPHRLLEISADTTTDARERQLGLAGRMYRSAMRIKNLVGLIRDTQGPLPFDFYPGISGELHWSLSALAVTKQYNGLISFAYADRMVSLRRYIEAPDQIWARQAYGDKRALIRDIQQRATIADTVVDVDEEDIWGF